ncbi:HU family DNA-binding protein [Paenibacillus sp. GCM10027626]|uniref:HU family DNA-binding protein n=1 Tax=Paenibacillus sp. GCM10027626 TaxID=3273411 RepID=UPI003641DC88
MNKKELTEAVAARLDASKKDIAQIVDAIVLTISTSLAAGEAVKIAGFGHFIICSRAPRKGRNIKSGAEVAIAARRAVKFKPLRVLRAAVNVYNCSP